MSEPNAPRAGSRHGSCTCEPDGFGHLPHCDALHPFNALAYVIAERDRMIRLWNRLEAAVSHHRNAHVAGGGVLFTDDADAALWKTRDKILTDFAEGKG